MRKMLLLLVFLVPAYPEVEKVAIVIGNNAGLSNEVPLRYACDDAGNIYEILNSLGGINNERSYLLTNSTKRKIFDTFREVSGRVKELKSQGKDVQLIVYFSGHGSKDAIHVEGEKLPMDTLKELFEEVNADLRILIADACNSGALIQQKGEKGGSLTSSYDINLKNDLGVRGTVFITSSSPSEFSHESKDLEGSLFTHYLASAMRGAADYDHDENISLWEAYTFAKVNTLRKGSSYKDFSQNPEFDFDISGSENVLMTNLGSAKSVLCFNGCPQGNYEIFNNNTMKQIAGIYFNRDDSIKLALPKSYYMVRHATHDKVYIGKIDLSWGGRRDVDFKSFRPFPLDALTKKGADIRFQPHSLMVQSTLMRGLPDGNNIWVFPELAYRYSFYSVSLSVQIGFIKDVLSGDDLSISRDILSGALTARYFALNRSRLKLFTGGQLRLIRMRQRYFRPREGEIRSQGYEPIPSDKAYIYGIGCNNGLQFNLPIPLSFDFIATPTLFLASGRGGKIMNFFRFPLTVAATWRF